MKGCYRILFLLLLVLHTLFSAASPPLRDTESEKTALRFRADGSFKIVQFTDLHYGEGEDVPWGPIQDVNSTRVMHKVCYLLVPLCLRHMKDGRGWGLARLWRLGEEWFFLRCSRATPNLTADHTLSHTSSSHFAPPRPSLTVYALCQVLDYEDADLVVFTGDQITGNNIRANATAYWLNLLQPCRARQLRWGGPGRLSTAGQRQTRRNRQTLPSRLSGYAGISTTFTRFT